MKKMIALLLAVTLFVSLIVSLIASLSSCDLKIPWEMGDTEDTNGVDDATPRIRINTETNEWEASYDSGQTWISLGVKATATNEIGVMSVETDEQGRLIVVLSDGTRLPPITIPHQCDSCESADIPDFWEDAVNECIARINALQSGKNSVTFAFFSDNHERNGYSGALIAKVMEECGIPYCFFGGDSISNGYIASEEEMLAQDKAFDDMIACIPEGRFCRAIGNHDGYRAASASEKYSYTRDQIYDLFLRAEGVTQNKNYGGEGTFYYVDDTASKVRWIVLDSNATPIGIAGDRIDSEQLAWIKDSALSFEEEGWGVVFISHAPIANPFHANVQNAEEVIEIIQAYINGTEENKADIIGWFSGHIHRDRIYTHLYVNGTDTDYDGEPSMALGFTQVTITSDYTAISYDDDTKHPTAEDDQSHAIDFVTINKDTRTVYITRLGIGEDRSYTY